MNLPNKTKALIMTSAFLWVNFIIFLCEYKVFTLKKNYHYILKSGFKQERTEF